MSGIVKISDASFWGCAGWTYDSVLKKMADIIRPKDAALADAIMHNRTDMSVGYYDIRKLDRAQFNLLIQAASAAYLQTVAAGPQSFAMPKFYPGYLKQMEIFLDMLRADPRAERLTS